MSNKINYNFRKIENIFFELSRPGKFSSNILYQLKIELNKFFNKSTCLEVLYTNNQDKPFFGMCVIPDPNGINSVDIIKGRYKPIERYYIDMDSRLFTKMNLNSKELTAILLHEVGHLVYNATELMKDISGAVNYSISRNGITIDYNDLSEQPVYANLGIIMTMRKIGSIFEKNNEEFYADEFVVNCGYGSHLQSAFEKIIKSRDIVTSSNQNKFVTLIWSLSVYKNLNDRRNSLLEKLNVGENLQSSTIMRRLFNNAINTAKHSFKIGQIGPRDEYIKEGFFDSIKFSPIKSLEEDLYEFKIRCSSIEDNDEAMDLLRSFNMRISLIDEYIKVKQNQLSQEDIKRLNGLSDKYKIMREDLVRKGSYDKKIYGMWMKYPELRG